MSGGPPDAIVVLGCPPLKSGAASPGLIRRVMLGTEIWKREAAQSAAPLPLVLSGGGAHMTEAEIMRRLARAGGVPEASILVEDRSRNTLENALECVPLLRSRRLHRVLLVTDRLHLPRAVLTFRLAGIEVCGWAGAAPQSRSHEALFAGREILAAIWNLGRFCLRRRQARRAPGRTQPRSPG